MLLSKTVMVRPTRTKYWLERGYNIGQYKNCTRVVYDVNTYIEVKVEDLPSGSHSIVEIKCDGCGEILKIEWKTYNYGKRKNEEYLCRQCASKERVENGRKTKLLKSKSFEQWCIENNRQDILDRWDYELNDYLPSEISYKTPKSYWFKCSLKKHESELNFVRPFVNGYEGSMKCNQCNSFAQYLINTHGDNALDLYWSNKNIVNPWNIDKCSNKKIWIKCKEKDYHEDYMVQPNNFIRGDGCPFCNSERRESILEEKVRLYLEKTNYIILHEYNCTIIPKNPKTKMLLPFDNEIKELKLIIEVNGIQHYEKCGLHSLKSNHDNTTPEYELHYQKLKDRYKRIKAIQNGYYYLEIPYWTDDEGETWKQLIDNKLNKMLIDKKAS